MSAETVSLVKGIYAALGTGDVPAVIGAMGPAIEWNEAENFPYADGNPYVGAEAILGGVFGHRQRMGRVPRRAGTIPRRSARAGPGSRPRATTGSDAVRSVPPWA